MVKILLFVPFILGAGGDGSVPDSALTEIAEAVVNRHRHLERLFLDIYYVDRHAAPGRVDRAISVHAPNRYFLDFMHFTGPGDAPWSDNDRFKLWLNDGQPNRAFKPFSRQWFPEAELDLNRYWSSNYCLGIGWHQKGTAFGDKEYKHLMLDFLFSVDERAHMRIMKQTEEVEGIACMKVESEAYATSQEFWFAPSLGFALVRRIVRDDKRQLNDVFTCSKFKSVTNSLWLPMQVTHDSYDLVDGQRSIKGSVQLDVTAIAVNEDVPDSLFDFTLPPGSLTLDGTGTAIGFKSGGRELLTFWSAQCIDYSSPKPAKQDFPLAAVFSSTASVAGLLTLAVVLWRRR